MGRESYSLTTLKRGRGHNLKDDKYNAVQGKSVCVSSSISVVHVSRVDITSVAGLLLFIKQRGLEAHLHSPCNTINSSSIIR